MGIMGWLVAPVITSIVGAILLVKVWDVVVGGPTNSFLEVARAVLFVGTWTAITTAAGMRGVDNAAKRLNGSSLLRRLRTLTSGGRP